MSPDVPPEADVIRLAREAMDMTAQAAAEASRAHDGKGVSAAYWRDVERGYGGRRGQRVPTRASARALAAMARVVGVMPAQLAAAGREDAARVLEEILRRAQEPATPEPPAEPSAESAEDIGDAVVTVLRARQGEPGVWADLRDYLATAGLFADSTEAMAWPPGEIPAKLTPAAKQALDAAASAGALFRDAVGDSAARLPYDWHLRVRMITQIRETVRNPTRARRAG